MTKRAKSNPIWMTDEEREAVDKALSAEFGQYADGVSLGTGVAIILSKYNGDNQ